MMNDFIFIYGPPGVGKSTVARLLAGHLKLDCRDLDEEIVSRNQKSIPEIFSQQGEADFRLQEKRILMEIVAGQPCVVALGGGALVDPETRKLVEAHGEVAFLEASLDVLCERNKMGNGSRPLLSGDLSGKLSALLSRRAAHYSSFPYRIETSSVDLLDVVWEVQKTLGRFRVDGMGPGYQVQVKNGLIDRVGSLLAHQGLGASVCIVTDENVAPIYAQRVSQSLEASGFKVKFEVLPPGEENKNLTTINRLWNTFLDAGLDRTSMVLALGGGVIGDLAGFAAATYMRGIHWAVVPTTLLAMVDSSVGGKTGFDLPRGKNLVGAFYPPRTVLVDPETLLTLPDIERRNGMAEVVKHGVIGSRQLFETCGKGFPEETAELEKLVREAAAIKIDVILKDPYERGIRGVLNLGHTVGHAVEHLSGYQVPHGFAVAIGMVEEARLSSQMGLAANGFVDALVDSLTGLGLPTEIPPEIDPGKMIEVMRLDKKTINGRIRFSLPVDVGNVQVGVEVDDLEKLFKKGVRQ